MRPLRTLIIAALIGIAGLALGKVYRGPLLPELVGGAAIGSVAISALLRRAPAYLIAPLSLLGLVAYSYFAIRISASSAALEVGTSGVADAARNAIPRLLTALIPVEPQPDTVLAPVVLAWLAGLAGAELAGRAGRIALGLLPPTMLYAGALVLVGPNAKQEAWQPLAFAALAALALATGARTSVSGLSTKDSAGLRARAATGVLAGLLAVLALVTLAVPATAGLVGRVPTDPRKYVQPPNLDLLDQNPLIRLSGWAANPDQHLLDVAVTGAAASPAPEEETAYDTRLRLAVLSDWDGVTWHSNTDYRNAGRVLPAVAPIVPVEEPAPPRHTEERITIAELDGRLLPAITVPRRVDGVRVAYDQLNGTLLHPTRLRNGIGYTVESETPSIDVSLLPAADVPSGEAVARYLAVGDTVPDDLRLLAEQVAQGEGSPYLRAAALETFISEHYRYVPDAPSGHAYPNLRFFLFGDPRAGGQRGTHEQFAASFAALGRLIGLPTRVVVGFRTPSGGGAIHGRDAIAWPEVLFTGVGWVPFDPMPDPGTPPRDLEDEFLPKPVPPTTPPASVETPEATTFSPAPAPPSTVLAGRQGPGVGVIATGVGGSVLLFVIGFLLVIVSLRMAQRRRRLERGSPPQRVLGAWDEVLDALALAGASPPPHLSATEVATHAGEVAASQPGKHARRRPRPAAPPLADLAALVNVVGFAGTTPAAAQLADESTAVVAGKSAAGYTTALRARRSWWRRLLWTIDPRPLRRRARR